MSTDAKPKITAIAPWFGGKRTLAPEVVKLLGKHSAYWEPFCGSCAVLFAKPVSQQETIIDLHGDLINLARVLKSDDAVELYARASRVLCDTEIYQEQIDAAPPADPLDAALRFLILSWMGRNGTSGTERTNYAPSIRFTPGGGSSPTRWRNAVESIPWWHERLRNVSILHRDSPDVIPKIADQDRVAIYCDPPYLMETRGKGGGIRYLHDFSEDEQPLIGVENDHKRLHRMLSKFEFSQVIVSYYDCPFVRELYSNWTFHEVYRQKNLHVQNRRGAGVCEAPEVLITNW